MERLIKSVPVIVIVSLLGFFFQSGDAEFSHAESSILCGMVVFMFTSLMYIFMLRHNKKIMRPGIYFVFMVAAAVVTYIVLYASLEYFLPDALSNLYL
ncbi:hypothetical protein R1T16_10745 [Flavobacterium sp. DG1-102-2]|uniref:hypothetical protein n=1 Tax=Flavobacterium sp. DG1-102-2 TaxID=3081663 RepID=UPI0029499D16|nr:hypothetical protein [Flavobacterium sp. DG1-102-2]MDV6168905.1 hypothetical protein [Flavobacterium sp. DG1-102-2]